MVERPRPVRTDASISDQAAGLRQLTGRFHPRTIGFLGGRGRVGKTSLVINIGAALAARGRRVLIVDEGSGSTSLFSRMGLQAPRSLQQVLEGNGPLESQSVSAIPNLTLLSFPADAGLFAGLNARQEARLVQQFNCLTQHIDFLLVDTHPQLSRQPLALATEERVILLSDHDDAMMDAYSFIKRFSLDFAQHEFWLVVNQASDYAMARCLFDRLIKVVQRYTVAQVRFLGFVPEDPRLHRANHLFKPVIQAFPNAPASAACQQLAHVLDTLKPLHASLGCSDFIRRLIHSSRALCAISSTFPPVRWSSSVALAQP